MDAAASPVLYRLRIPQPATHLVHVEVEARGVSGPARLVMPAWTPGSYLMREFARNVQEFSARDGAGNPLPWRKTDKGSWSVEAPGDGVLRARYVVYANELSVRTSHVDATHAAINGASVFMFLAGRETAPVRLEVDVPADWGVTTSLRGEGNRGPFTAAHYDELLDSPLEIGRHQLIQWEVDGVRHRWAVWGKGNWIPDRLVVDTTKIVLAERELWGALPYRDYTFILHLTPGGYGGLEHRESTVLLADRWGFRGKEYEGFLGLTAHELFHAWNGKRLRPAALGPFDYERETYTRELWVVEGITTYYTDLVLRRAGIMTPERYLEKLAEQVSRMAALPGRSVQSLEESSFDTWIKFYRPDAHTPNAQVSYYHKGALVALLLDLTLRADTGNRASMDAVVRTLWSRWGAGDVGFPEGEAERVVSELAGRDMGPELHRWLRGTDELEVADVLARAGLLLLPAEGAPPGSPGQRTEAMVGLRLREEGGRTLVTNVLAGSTAHAAGVNAGDELVALDGFRIAGADWLALRLGERLAGTSFSLSLFRRDELLTLTVELGPPAPTRFRIVPATERTPEQDAILSDWLRTVIAPEVSARDASGGAAGPSVPAGTAG